MARAKKPYVRMSYETDLHLISIVGTPQSPKLVRASYLIPAVADRATRVLQLHEFLLANVRYTKRQAAYLREQARKEAT